MRTLAELKTRWSDLTATENGLKRNMNETDDELLKRIGSYQAGKILRDWDDKPKLKLETTGRVFKYYLVGNRTWYYLCIGMFYKGRFIANAS